MGADILRLWVSATDYSGEMAVSKQILQRSADAYRRIRNTARFLLSNLDGFDPAQHMVPNDQLIALDRWAIDRALLLQREIEEAYTTYRFWNVYQKVHNFCVQELGGFYLTSSRTASTPPAPTVCRGVPARLRCTTLPRRWCAGSHRSRRSPPKRSGSTCRASVTSR